eukprot:8889488-Karenia_brevis.AAC.1
MALPSQGVQLQVIGWLFGGGVGKLATWLLGAMQAHGTYCTNVQEPHVLATCHGLGRQNQQGRPMIRWH